MTTKTKKARKDKVIPSAEEILNEALETIEAKEAKRVIGRPVAINTVEEMEERIVQYLNDMGRFQLPSKAGLAFALGVCRDTLNEYEKKPGFSDILKHWYPYFEDRWVQNLSRPNATGTIFYLKNTYGYMDTMDHTSGGQPINYTIPKEIAEKHQMLILDAPIVQEPITQDATQQTEGGGE